MQDNPPRGPLVDRPNQKHDEDDETDEDEDCLFGSDFPVLDFPFFADGFLRLVPGCKLNGKLIFGEIQ